MTIENVRLVETIDKDDPRYAELIKFADDDDFDFAQDKHGNWYVPATGESVTFATKEDEAQYKRDLKD
jgi:hypothetical protein